MTRYLRVVVTPRCTLSCSYCHLEGDPATAARLSTPELIALLKLAVDQGIRKLKFLGGEPLLRTDLPQIIAAIAHPELDISLITAGAVQVARLKNCFEAGLNRANLSLHGWTEAAFARRGGNPTLFAWRQENLAFLLKQGHFLKLNYVWSSPDDNIDLSKMLQEIPRAPVVLNLLDDLNQDIGPSRLLDLLKTLRGPWNQQWVEPDPNSLSTLKLQWEDGLLVEIKDQQLGQVAPWKACQTCPVKSRCKEGIHALRLTHQGLLKPCMDRPELQLNLKALVGQDYAADAWNHFVGAV